MTIRLALAALFLMTGMAMAAPSPTPDPSESDPGHLVSPTADANGAVTRQAFEARFDTSATELLAARPGVRADRFAAFDIARPRDAEEWKRLKGNAVILVGALSQDGSELPLAKAYLESADGTRVILQRLGFVHRTLPSTSLAAKTFGPNVTEEFYLVPASALGNNVAFKCDFAKNRLGFVLSTALTPLKDAPAAQAAGAPPAAAVRTMVAREYPGFGIALMDGVK